MSHVGPYVGRFAPSPTGPLHFGSLVAALASWLDCRSAGGRWYLRMEDLDRPRVVPGAADAILRQLEHFGLWWDGPVVYQSARLDLYRETLGKLASQSYPCACTRKELEDSASRSTARGSIPGTCRGGIPAGKSARAVRVRTDAAPIRFCDRDRRNRAVRRSRGRRFRAAARGWRLRLPACGGRGRRRARRDRRSARRGPARFDCAADSPAAAAWHGDAALPAHARRHERRRREAFEANARSRRRAG